LQGQRSKVARQLPLLAGLYVACTAAAAAISVTIDEPAYEWTLHLTITAGLLISLLASGRRRSPVLVAGLIIAGAFAAYAVRDVGAVPLLLLYPPEVLTSNDVALAALMAWLMAGLCFVQVRRENAILCLVAGLAILGLMATINLNSELLVIFAVYLFATIYTWAYDNLLARHQAAGATKQMPWLAWGRRQLPSVALLFVTMTMVAVGVGNGLYYLSPKLFAGLPHISRRWQPPTPPVRSRLAFGNQFPVGTGPIRLSNRVAFTVNADYPAQWRGQVYPTYDGRRWLCDQNQQFLPTTSGGRYVVPGTDELQGLRNRQTFRLTTAADSALYAAAHPQQLTIRQRPNSLWGLPPLMADSCGNITAIRQALTGTEYEVISIMPKFTQAQLATARADYPTALREDYIDEVPLECQARLNGLAAQITTTAKTPYQKVEAILSYLSENYLYTYNAPAVPQGRDAAVHFLLRSKQGACDLFATAAAVLCRLTGIPARVVTGFATGEYDPDQQIYVVRGTDAHAWVEVYFTGLGWVPFDPQASETLEEQTMGSLFFRHHQFMLVAGKVTRTLLPPLALVVVLGLAARALVDPRLIYPWWHRWRTSRQPWSRLERQWRRFYQIASQRRGQRPQQSDSPCQLLSAAQRDDLLSRGIYAMLCRATDDLCELRYSGSPVTTTQVRRQQRRWAWLCRRIQAALRRK